MDAVKDMEVLYTISDVAELFKVSKKTVTKEIKENKLRGALIGAKWRFSKENIQEYLESRTPVKTRRK